MKNLISMAYKTNGRENSIFHNFFMKVQNNPYTFLNLKHLYLFGVHSLACVVKMQRNLMGNDLLLIVRCLLCACLLLLQHEESSIVHIRLLSFYLKQSKLVRYYHKNEFFERNFSCCVNRI